MSDRDLIDIAARAKRYDTEAFAELFDIFFEKLRRYMYYKTGDLDTVEDLAAEALTEGLENIQGFEDRGGTIGAWLFGIARNLLARRREASGKVKEVELDEATPVSEEEVPERLVVVNLSHEELYDALGRLPEEQREVVLLRFMERYDVKTVAGIMGRRPGAVRALQYRAIVSLRRMLEAGETG